MSGKGNGQQRKGRRRYAGWLEAGEVERNHLPEIAAIPLIGKQFEVELHRQQDKETHGIQRDEKPLDPLPDIRPGAL